MREARHPGDCAEVGKLCDLFQLADLVLDSASHRVTRAAREIELTAKEYALLEFLARRAGQLVSRTDIAAHVWDDHPDLVSHCLRQVVGRYVARSSESAQPGGGSHPFGPVCYVGAISRIAWKSAEMR